VRADLINCGIQHTDLDPARLEPPAISSIIVTQNTGERAVISLNAKNTQIPAKHIPKDILAGVKILLIDAHQREVSEVLARAAREQGIPVVMDGGSWKPNLERILPWVDYAICSGNFYPPDCHTTAEVFAYLAAQGISYRAITQGSEPILYQTPQESGLIHPPIIPAVDTLSAGDILHGAFCHFLLLGDFAASLAAAAQTASHSCKFLGPRAWMKD
jgi:sugar/nucleoside kinase (ribokinase family)